MAPSTSRRSVRCSPSAGVSRRAAATTSPSGHSSGRRSGPMTRSTRARRSGPRAGAIRPRASGYSDTGRPRSPATRLAAKAATTGRVARAPNARVAAARASAQPTTGAAQRGTSRTGPAPRSNAAPSNGKAPPATMASRSGPAADGDRGRQVPSDTANALSHPPTCHWAASVASAPAPTVATTTAGWMDTSISRRPPSNTTLTRTRRSRAAKCNVAGGWRGSPWGRSTVRRASALACSHANRTPSTVATSTMSDPTERPFAGRAVSPPTSGTEHLALLVGCPTVRPGATLAA